ncbi:MAG: hypothetical protein ACK5YL_01825, partial [Holosporales bacterium]
IYIYIYYMSKPPPSQIEASIDALYKDCDTLSLPDDQKSSILASLETLKNLGVTHYNADAPQIQKLIRGSILGEDLLSSMSRFKNHERVPLAPEDALGLYQAYIIGQILLNHDSIKVPFPNVNTYSIDPQSRTYEDCRYCERLLSIVEQLDRTIPMAEQIQTFLQDCEEIDTTKLVATGQQQDTLGVMGMVLNFFGKLADR